MCEHPVNTIIPRDMSEVNVQVHNIHEWLPIDNNIHWHITYSHLHESMEGGHFWLQES